MRVVVVSHLTPGAKAGANLRPLEALALARLLIKSGTTDPTGACVTPSTDSRTAARRSARRWALLVAVGWLLQAGLRAWFSRGQSVPLANPDESAYLIAGRVLAGGPATDFSYSTLYQAGYPLLISPVYWFTSNAVTVYHAVLVINAAVSALLMPLAYVAGRRLGLVRPAAYVLAMVTALLPAGLVLVASVGGAWLLDRYLSATMYPEGTRSLTGQTVSTLHSVNGAIDVFEMAAGQFWRLVLDSWGLAGVGLFASRAGIPRPRFRTDPALRAPVGRGGTLMR